MTAKSYKIVFLALLVVMLTVAEFASGAAAVERPPQRRRNNKPTEVELGGSSSAPRLMTSLTNQRRSNSRQNGGKAHFWDIAESCKVEPGCEWTCTEDVYDCTCRCKLDGLHANARYASRDSRISPR